jgi:threonine/homoserine/homoserine lactone efflux protein
MLGGLLTFLIGCLVLAVVLYVFNLVLGMITLPGNVKQIALIIVGLIGLLLLVYLAVGAFRAGPVVVEVPLPPNTPVAVPW